MVHFGRGFNKTLNIKIQRGDRAHTRMAMNSFRRAIASPRKLSLLLRTSSYSVNTYHHHHFSQLASAPSLPNSPDLNIPQISPTNYFFQIRRGYAKKRNTQSTFLSLCYKFVIFYENFLIFFVIEIRG